MKPIVYKLLITLVVFAVTLTASNEANAQCGNVSSYTPTASSYTICSDNTVYIYANGLPVSRWIYRDNNTGPWLTYSITSSDNISQYVSVTTTTTRTYRAVVSTPSCASDTTAGVDVVINPITYGTNLSAKLSASAYTACGGASVTVYAMNEGLRIDRWLYRENNGSWFIWTTSNTQTLNVTLPTTFTPATRDFRILVRNGCNYDSSDIVTININPTVNGNNPSIKPFLNNSSNSICAGTTGILNVEWPFSFGNWIYRDSANGPWGTISSGGSFGYDYNTTVTQLTNREYRVLLRNEITCTSDTSASEFLEIRPALRTYNSSVIPRTNNNNTYVCAGNSMQFNLTGFNNISTWQYRDSSNAVWINFGGSSTAPSVGSSSGIAQNLTRTVRVILNNSQNTCSYDTSAEISYTIRANRRGNTTTVMPHTSSNEICAGANISVYLQNQQGISNWLQRDNSTGNWQTTGSSSGTYTNSTNGITVNTQRAYRALINNTALCTIDTTPEVSVLIRVPQPGGNIALTPTMNQPAYCSGTSVSGFVNLPSSSLQASQWLYRDNNTGAWLQLQFQTGSSFNDGTTNSITISTIRSYRLIVRNLERFTLDTTLEASVVINPVTRGTFPVVPVTPTPTICNDNSVQLQIVPPAGYTVNNWLQRDTTTQNWNSFSFGSTSTSNFISTSFNTRTYRVLLVNTGLCRFDTTNALVVTVNKRSGRTNTGWQPIANATSICSGSQSVNFSISLPSGVSVSRWQRRDNGGAWQDIFSSSTSYTESANNLRVLVNTVREMRAILNENNNCTTDTTASVSLTITPYTNGTTSGITPVAGSASYCAGANIGLSFAYPGTVQKWIYSDNNGAWRDVEGSSNSSNYTFSTNHSQVNTITNRRYRAILFRQNACLMDTTQWVDVEIRPRSFGNAPFVQPTTSTPNICSGNSLSVSIPSSSAYSAHKWIYRENNTGQWLDIPSFSQSTNFNISSVSVLTPTQRTYRAIIWSSSCSYDTTAAVSLQINPRTYGYANATTITSSQGVYCSGSTVSASVISATMPSGSSIHRWVYRDNMNGEWTEIPGSSSTFMSQGNVFVFNPTTRSYRAIINNNNTCTRDSSAVYSVSINPSVNGYALNIQPTSGTTAICNATNNPTISVSIPSGYNFNRWIINDNNTGWKFLPYTANSTSFVDYMVNVSNPTIRAYRALATNTGTCSIDSSAVYTININPRVSGNLNTVIPNTTNNRTNYCYSLPVSLTVNVPSGYSVERWIYTDNSGAQWNDFVNSTNSSSLTDNNTYVAATTSRAYRVILFNSSTCQRDTTAARTVIINARSTGGTASSILPTASGASICSGSTVNVNVSLPSGQSLIRWTYSDNGPSGPWFDAWLSYNNNSYTHQLTQTETLLNRLYRAIISDTSACEYDSTQAVMVTIRPTSRGIDTSITVTGPDTVCVGTAASLSVTPGSGNSVSKWIFRDNSGPWQDFSNSTASSFLTDNNTLVAVGTTRGYTPIIFKNATCSFDTLTKVRNVYFKDKTYGNSTTTVSISSLDTVCAGSTVNAFISGTVERWIYRDGNSGNWLVIPNSASTSISHNNTNIVGAVWRYYRAILRTASCNADTSRADSIFIKNQTFGNIAALPTVSPTTLCAGSSANISVSISNSTVQRWLYRDNNGPWQILSVTSSTSVQDFNTNVSAATTRSYAAIVFKNCSYDTTLSANITINPKTRGNDPSRVPASTSTSVCAGTQIGGLSLNTSGITIVRWLYRDNNGPWQLFANGNQNNLTDYNTFTGSTITRQYVVIVDNNTTCSIDTTNPRTVTINPIVVSNSSLRTPTVPATACMGNSYNVAMTVTGDTSIIRIVYNTNGGSWIDRGYISPTNNVSVSEFAGSNSVAYTRGYRMILYNSTTCRVDTTQSSTVTITPRTFGNDNTITPSGLGTVCSGVTFSVNVTPGTGNSVNRWLFSDDNGATWNTIFSTSNNISHSATTTSVLTRRYRAIISKGATCSLDTTNTFTMTINPIVYGTDNVITPSISGSNSICIGSTVTISVVPGSGNSVNTWLFRNNGGAWLNAFASSNIFTDYNTNVTSTVVRNYTPIIWKPSSCAMDTLTKADTATISPRVLGNDTTITISTSGTNVCTGAAITLTAVNMSTHSIERWLVRNNGGAWTTLTSSTSQSVTDFNTNVSSVVNRDYVAIIRKSNSCTSDTCKVLSVTISPRLNGNDNGIVLQPTTPPSVCSGTAVGMTVNPGSGNTIQGWLMSQNGGAFNLVSSSSATSYTDFNTTVSVSTTRVYRALIVKGSGCSIDTSASLTYTINPIGFGNQNSVAPVANNSNVCTGTPVNLNVSGFAGASVLRWVFRDNNTGNWNVINNGSSTITDFNTSVTAVTARTYRAIVNNNTGCSTDTTGGVTVTLNPITNTSLTTPTQSSQATVCAGSSINVFINPGTGYSVHSWLVREGSGNWEVASNSTSTSVNFFNTSVSANVTRQYRAMLRSTSGCSIDSAAPVTVQINIISEGTNLSIVPTTTTSTICSGNTATISVSGFSGNVVRWLYRDSVTDGWSNIFNTNFTLFHTNTFVPYTRTRQYRAIVYNAANCSNDTTAAVSININPQLAGNANSIAPTTLTPTLCSGSSISMNVTGFINGGVVTGWLYSDDGGAWTPIASTSNTLNHSATTVSQLTNRQYRALVLTGCVTDTTAPLSVTIDVYPAKPVVNRTGNTLSSSITAATYQWKRNGVNIPGATAQTLDVTQDGDYSVEVGNASGCKIESDPLNVVITGIANSLSSRINRVYPNPTTSGKVWVEFSNMTGTEVTLEVRDITGRLVMSHTQVMNSNALEVDLQQEQSGVYFFTLRAEGQTVIKRVVYSK